MKRGFKVSFHKSILNINDKVLLKIFLKKNANIRRNKEKKKSKNLPREKQNFIGQRHECLQPTSVSIGL